MVSCSHPNIWVQLSPCTLHLVMLSCRPVRLMVYMFYGSPQDIRRARLMLTLSERPFLRQTDWGGKTPPHSRGKPFENPEGGTDE